MSETSTGLERFVSALANEEKHLEHADWRNGRRPFITISREAGAGGHALASSLMRQMAEHPDLELFKDWQMFDQEIYKQLSSNPRIKVSLDSLLAKEYRSVLEDMVLSLVSNATPQSEVLAEMFRLIRTLATWGRVILVGRASSFLTRELPLGVHVRLVAPRELRVKRMAAFLNVPEPKAAAMIDEQDEARRKLVKTYFTRDIRDPLSYDVVFNTDAVSIGTVASTILRLVDYRCREWRRGNT